MTPDTALKKLAEFGVWFIATFKQITSLDSNPPFLSIEIGGTHISIDEHTLFKSDLVSPVLMHLAQEELEKRGFRIVYVSRLGDDSSHGFSITRRAFQTYSGYHKSKFIAFWLAVEQAMKGGE